MHRLEVLLLVDFKYLLNSLALLVAKSRVIITQAAHFSHEIVCQLMS